MIVLVSVETELMRVELDSIRRLLLVRIVLALAPNVARRSGAVWGSTVEFNIVVANGVGIGVDVEVVVDVNVVFGDGDDEG